MPGKKKKHPKIKTALHPRNKHRTRYDFERLIADSPELAEFVQKNDYGDESIDFFHHEAVITLNKALLKTYYGIRNWDIPRAYLCPPVPGRADYIHYVADLLSHHEQIPRGKKVKCLDIGVGANIIYPLIGVAEYGWSFVGSDIDSSALAFAGKIIAANPSLRGRITLRKQRNPAKIFEGIIHHGERFDAVICNPPFYGSPEEAKSATTRKLNNLTGIKSGHISRNFGGQSNELWCEGGEKRFIKEMIFESKEFADHVLWFTTLVSKQAHLDYFYKILGKIKPKTTKIIPMGQGNKKSRILAWSFGKTGSKLL